MSDVLDEVVRVASGTMPQVEVWHAALANEGIDGRVVGEELDAGLGTVLADSVEVWVRRADYDRAVEVLRRLDAERGEPFEA